MHLTRVLCGATRRVMTGKDGNKNFYKGRGVRNPGFHTSRGGYILVKKKIPEYVVPNLNGFEMKPYVSYRAPLVRIPPLTADRLVEELKANISIVQHTEVP